MTRPAREAAVIAAALLLAGAGGCSSHRQEPGRSTPAGCGLVPAETVERLVPGDLVVEPHGDLERLGDHGGSVSCTASSRDDPARYVSIEVTHHPRPLDLAERGCDQGWVYAGSADRFAPSCQESTGDDAYRTTVLTRQGAYVVTVAIGRPDRQWAGDPESGLALSQQVSARLVDAVPQAR